MAYGTRFGRSDFEQLAISYKSYALRAILSSYTLLSPTRYASRGTHFRTISRRTVMNNLLEA